MVIRIAVSHGQASAPLVGVCLTALADLAVVLTLPQVADRVVRKSALAEIEGVGRRHVESTSLSQLRQAAIVLRLLRQDVLGQPLDYRILRSFLRELCHANLPQAG